MTPSQDSTAWIDKLMDMFSKMKIVMNARLSPAKNLITTQNAKRFLVKSSTQQKRQGSWRSSESSP